MTSGSRSFENADEQFRRGLALAKKGLWQEALTAYKESLRLNPNNAQTYMNLVFVYYELGYDEEAQQAFDRASRLEAGPYKR